MNLKKITKWFFDKFINKSFVFWQKLGLNILPNHFYSPIPDLNELDQLIWKNKSQLVGIDLNEEKQLQLLSLFNTKYKDEYDKLPKNYSDISKPYQYFLNNEYFGPISGEFLYCAIRHFKPKRIVEIGSGFSSYLIANTILKNKETNKDYNCKFISIDPYPNKVLSNGFPGLSKLVPKKVQLVPLEEFEKLEKNDILFIDSSHVLKIGGDLQYEYLEILPRLNKGVIIHIHDIFLPLEYPPRWILNDKLFWNEQYLLQAFLMFNNYFEIIFAGNYLFLNHSEILNRYFDSYHRSRGSSSFWIRRIK